MAAIFRCSPKQEDVLINITSLWSDADFRGATDAYRHDEGADVFRRIGDNQKEVVLRCDLTLDGAYAFCERVPTLEEICKSAGITAEAEIDAIYDGMVKRNVFPFDKYWIEGDAAQNALNRMLTTIAEKWKERGLIKPRNGA